MSRLLPDPLHTDSTQEGGPEFGCAHCDDGVYFEELVDSVWELRHDATGKTTSADGSHEAEAAPL